VFYHLYAKATIALHAMKKISAQSAPKTTQVAKRTMVDTPEEQHRIRSAKYHKIEPHQTRI
jgi:hypothetical protein